MKKPIIIFAAIALLASCMPTTQITGAWKNPKQPGNAYSSVFVASLTSNSIARATVESDMVSAFEKQGITAYKSIDEFPPGIKKDSLTKEDIMGRMRNKNADAILTVSLISKETETRYIPGSILPYEPFPRYSYYADFWGYYSYWQPYAFNPGYYDREKVYYMEANLYNSATEQLVWSAQSRTYNSRDLLDFSEELSKTIVTKLKEDGMLKPVINLSTGK